MGVDLTLFPVAGPGDRSGSAGGWPGKGGTGMLLLRAGNQRADPFQTQDTRGDGVSQHPVFKPLSPRAVLVLRVARAALLLVQGEKPMRRTASDKPACFPPNRERKALKGSGVFPPAPFPFPSAKPSRPVPPCAVKPVPAHERRN